MFLICKPNCPRTDIFLECWELLLIYNKSLVCNSINNTGCPNCTECSWQHKAKRCVNRKYIQMCASLQLDKTGKYIALELYLYEHQINIIHGHSLRIPVMDMVSVVSVSCMVTERRKLSIQNLTPLCHWHEISPLNYEVKSQMFLYFFNISEFNRWCHIY